MALDIERSRPTLDRRRLLALGAASLAAQALPVRAGDAWPAKPIRIVAGQAPGSSNDSTARAFADMRRRNWAFPSWWRTSPAAGA